MTRYIALEGPDGCGKTTQAQRLVGWLEARGHRVRAVREPGSTPVGEALRRLLLDPASGELSAVAEALLFSAARAELVRREVAPALASGAVVVADRCWLSTFVYQGVACDHGLGLPLLASLTGAVHAGTAPHLVFVLDVPYEVSRARRGGAGLDRIEGRARAFHERVRQGYLSLAKGQEPIAVIDAAGDADAVHREIAARVSALFESRS